MRKKLCEGLYHSNAMLNIISYTCYYYKMVSGVHINNTRNFFEQHINMCHSIVSSAYRSPPSNLVAVTLARQLEGVLADPSGAAGASLGLVETLAVAKTSMLLTG